MFTWVFSSQVSCSTGPIFSSQKLHWVCVGCWWYFLLLFNFVTIIIIITLLIYILGPIKCPCWFWTDAAVIFLSSAHIVEIDKCTWAHLSSPGCDYVKIRCGQVHCWRTALLRQITTTNKNLDWSQKLFRLQRSILSHYWAETLHMNQDPLHRALEDSVVLNLALLASQWGLVVGQGKMPGLGCWPLQCQALSVSACCCSRGFHPIHNPNRPLLQSPQAHQRLIFHASGPAGEAHSQGQVGGRGGLRRLVSQHLSLGRVLGPGQ